MNHRQGERITVDIPVISQERNQPILVGRVQNLSFSGACIRCDTAILPDQNTRLQLTLQFQAETGCEPIHIRTQGYVVRKVGKFVGIMFEREKAWLVSWLKAGKLLRSTRYKLSA